jgi:hypothetical protein
MGIYFENLMHNNPKFEKGGMDSLLGDLIQTVTRKCTFVTNRCIVRFKQLIFVAH